MTQQLARPQTDAWSLAEIGRRIDLYNQPGFGLYKATPEQLNLLSLYCQKMQLLPGEEVTLYEGAPWITIDGRVTLMRRHPNYLSFKNRPLTRDEKELWMYDPEDLVIECVIKRKDGEEISARGKVSKAERAGQGGGRLNPVARFHPVEMAEKRAMARAERFAFGTAHDDEDPEEVARVVVQERNDPMRVQQNSDTYDRIYGDAYPDDRTQASYVHTEQQQPSEEPYGAEDHPDEEPAAGPQDAISGTPDSREHAALLASNAKLVAEARAAGISKLAAVTADDTWPTQAIREANDKLYAAIAKRNGDKQISDKQGGLI